MTHIDTKDAAAAAAEKHADEAKKGVVEAEYAAAEEHEKAAREAASKK